MRRIYHGSINVIEKPTFGIGKVRNDYGLGFYCTEDINLAKEWGASRDKNGYANIYEINDDELTILNLNSPNYSVLHWLSILLENRIFDITTPLAKEAKEYLLNNFLPQYKSFDIIIGNRADDSYFSFAQDFINGAISVRQLGNAMKLGGLGNQYVLKSKKAFERLHYLRNEIVLSSEYYLKKEQRDHTARRQYFDQEKIKRSDIYIIQILNEEIKADDSRLR
ncbi:DUF3990 domain-containing protein [Spirochaetales bacterium NM-380-WT-3C1]|uniref:DUF3990 domain-containing protein n=1 Tax=Bullifex porci TaxID=2606638 RepID=A0A7X2PEF9_9SPIO|nr:DUF3990 domain-containing protein [Bullifex porci]MSU07277.1 DUF3990 domain-containing protein [Bullifex porci]